MILYIYPYKKLGPIRLSAYPQEVRGVIPGKIETEEKNVILGIKIDAKDYFPDHGIIVHYGDDNRSCFIEVDDRNSLIFSKMNLFKKSSKYLSDFFFKIDPGIVLENDGFTSFKFGISIYSTLFEDRPDLPPQLVSIFKENYYYS